MSVILIYSKVWKNIILKTSHNIYEETLTKKKQTTNQKKRRIDREYGHIPQDIL